MASLWNSLTETVTDYATPLKNSVVDLLNEADEQAADFLTPQQDEREDFSDNDEGGEHEELTSPREYVVKLLKEENESLKSIIHQQQKEFEDFKLASSSEQQRTKTTANDSKEDIPSWPEDDDANENTDDTMKEFMKLKEELSNKTNLATMLEKDLEESRITCEKQQLEIESLEKKKKKALERAKRAKEDAAAVVRLQKKKNGVSVEDVEKLQAQVQELENVKQQHEAKFEELDKTHRKELETLAQQHDAQMKELNNVKQQEQEKQRNELQSLLATKHDELKRLKGSSGSSNSNDNDYAEEQNKSNEEKTKIIKQKAKEMLQKTNEKYKKMIRSLKVKHQEEMSKLENTTAIKQEEKMKTSMLEYENTISELRMNENIAQQKVTELITQTQELEKRNGDLMQANAKLESAAARDNSDSEEILNNLRQQVEGLKTKNTAFEVQIATYVESLQEKENTAKANEEEKCRRELELKEMEQKLASKELGMNLEANEQIDELQNELNAITKKLSESTRNVEKLKSLNSDAKKQTDHLEIQLSAVTKQFNESLKEIEVLNASNEDYKRQVDNLQTELHAALSKVDESMKEVVSLNSSNIKSKNVVDTLQAQVDDLHATLKEMTKRLNESTKRLETVNSAKDDSQKQVQDMQKQLNVATSKLHTLTKDYETLQKDAEVKVTNLKKQITNNLTKEHEDKLSAVTQELDRLRAESKALIEKNKADLTEQDKVKTNKLTVAFDKEIQKLKNDLREANEAQASWKSKICALEEDLRAEKENANKMELHHQAKVGKLQEALEASRHEVKQHTKALDETKKTELSNHTKFKQQCDAKLKDIEKMHSSTISKQADEINSLKASYDRLTGEHDEKVKKLEATHSAIISKYTKEIKGLNVAREKQEEEYTQKLKALQEGHKTIISKHTDDIKSLTATHERVQGEQDEKAKTLMEKHNNTVLKHVNEIKALREEHAAKSESLIKTHSTIVAKHTNEVKLLQEKHSNVVSKHDEEVAFLKKTHDNILLKHTEEINCLKASIQDARLNAANSVKAKHKAEVEELILKQKEEVDLLKQEFLVKESEIQAQFSSSQSSSLNEMESLKELLKNKDAECQSKVKAIEEKHGKDKTRLELKLKKVNAIVIHHKKELDACKDKRNTEKELLKQEYENKIKAVSEEYAAKLKKANALVLQHKKQFDQYAEDNKNNLNDMHNEHKSAIHKLEEEHNEATTQMKEEHQMQIEEYKTQMKLSMDKKSSDDGNHSKDMLNLKRELKNAMQASELKEKELSDFIKKERIQNETDASKYKTKIAELQSALATHVEENEALKNQVKTAKTEANNNSNVSTGSIERNENELSELKGELLDAKLRIKELKNALSQSEASVSQALKKRLGTTINGEDGDEDFRAVDIESGLSSSNIENDKQRREMRSLISEFKMAINHLSPKVRQYTYIYLGLFHVLLLILMFSSRGGVSKNI